MRWQDITLTEARDGKDKLHLYFITYEQIPDKQVDNAPEMIDKKDANLAPSNHFQITMFRKIRQ